MRSKLIVVIIFILILVFATSVFADEKSQDLSIAAEGISLLDIDCGSGFLKVTGKEGLSNIEVQAEIIVAGMSAQKTKKFIHDKLVLSLEKRGQKAYLVSKFKSYFSLFSIGTKAINLTVFVPKTIELKVDDGSGDISIVNIQGNINIDDGSGKTTIMDVQGDLNVDDGSGDLTLQDIKGNIEIEDGSGDITIENAEGNALINDNSGDIRLEEIQGEVAIDDGSGSIHVQGALGDVTISDGSGSISVDNVEKDVVIKGAGSGGVTITNVKGQVKK